MKTVKIILGIIIAITVVFFATGLIFKETMYVTKVEVNKPVNEVFALFNDSSKIKNWIPELESIIVVDEKPEKTGSTYKLTVKNNNGEEISLREKVMAFVPNEKVTLLYNTDTMFKTNDYTFSFENGVTTIENKAVCKGSTYILSCLFPYFKSTFKKQDQQYLENFKLFAEKNS